MGEWLIADLFRRDVQVQFWMLLVTGIVLFWFLYVWTTRSSSLRLRLKLMSAMNEVASGQHFP